MTTTCPGSSCTLVADNQAIECPGRMLPPSREPHAYVIIFRTAKLLIRTDGDRDRRLRWTPPAMHAIAGAVDTPRQAYRLKQIVVEDVRLHDRLKGFRICVGDPGIESVTPSA